MCGEYGKNQVETRDTKLGRPHFHAIIFGHDFPLHEKELIEERNGQNLYTHPRLEEIWGKGMVSIGEVTTESAGYVARYCTKKIGGELAEEHYRWTCKLTGESHKLRPEFSTQSRRPGIGADWLKKYGKDLYKGYITINGSKVAIPKYYERNLPDIDDHYDGLLPTIKRERECRVDDLDNELTGTRLRTRERVKEIQTSNLKREL